jgi:hypothetical protein
MDKKRRKEKEELSGPSSERINITTTIKNKLTLPNLPSHPNHSQPATYAQL